MTRGTKSAGVRAKLVSLATAVPANVLRQDEVTEQAAALFGSRRADLDRLLPIFKNTGIDTRYSVQPLAWFHRKQGWPERTAAYLDGATELLVDAAEKALATAGVSVAEIDTVVTVSSTGIATPSLEARAHARMDSATMSAVFRCSALDARAA